ncbi:MAG: hypothetical protein M1835_002331 [Candelina submexicana]|nr:MAG: hypothetical protein M1835_002331 [Candelina submexicana]
MGTPHCGSSLANVGYDISREFAIVASELGLHLTSFYELNPFSPPFWILPKRIIVEKRSAILGLPNEEILAVHGHHGELCKFESAEDPNFRPVWIRIEHYSAHAGEKLQAAELDTEGMQPTSCVIRRVIKNFVRYPRIIRVPDSGGSHLSSAFKSLGDPDAVYRKS